MVYQELFDYMKQELDVLLLETDAAEIERIIKKKLEPEQCNIADVVGRSEQLAAFLKWYYENDECPDLVTYEAAAERFLSR